MVVIPLEISVSDTPGLYLAQDGLDFGMSGSTMPPTTLPLMVYSSAQKPVFVEVRQNSLRISGLTIMMCKATETLRRLFTT